jgi:hypothetical protein
MFIVCSFRPLIEEVRNCTRVAKDVQNEILQIVVDKLLSIETPLDVAEDAPVVRQDWNAGGTIPIAQISEFVPKRLLDQIKNECGGLQVNTSKLSFYYAVRSL